MTKVTKEPVELAIHIITESLSVIMWYPKGQFGIEFIYRNLWNRHMRNALGRHLGIIM